MSQPDPLLLPLLMSKPVAGGKGTAFRISEAEQNNERLRNALRDAIQSRGKIFSEQARIDSRIAEYEAQRASLLQSNAPPMELAAVENEIADAAYHRWLVEQQLNRAADSAEERLAYLESLNTPEKQDAELVKCADGLAGLLHWWKMWAWTADPRPDAPLMYVPFMLFPFQEDCVQWLYQLVFERMKDGHLDKSRDLGASWIAITFAAACWLRATQDQPFLCTFGSRKEQFVDVVGDPDTLLEKVRIVLRMLPGWMLPKGFSFAKDCPTLRIFNPATRSLIKGESANEDFARAGRQTLVVFDEGAAWPSGGHAAWTAASESSRTRLMISTPQGKFNKFGELKEDKNIPHFSLWWYQHPWKTQQAFEIAARRLTEVELAQEWLLDYEGSVAGRLLWMFSECHSVITWSEFVKIFGESAIGDDGRPRIPQGWKHRIAADCGTTDDHPSVIMMAAMSPANSLLPRHLFFHEEIMMGEGAHPLILAPLIKAAAKRYFNDVEAWLISHEANAERLIYNEEFGLPFQSWDTEAGYTQGYPQCQHYFTPYPGLNPFRPQIEGHPRAFIIVEDRQGALTKIEQPEGALTIDVEVKEPVASLGIRKEYIQKLIARAKREWKVAPPLNDEGGFKRTREELPRIHIPQSEAGKPVKAQRHFKRFDDAFDVVRAILAQMPTMVSLTESEKVQQRLRAEFKANAANQTMAEFQYTAFYAYQEERHQIEKDLARENSPNRQARSGEPVRTIRDLRRR